jgi:hypothetical protein
MSTKPSGPNNSPLSCFEAARSDLRYANLILGEGPLCFVPEEYMGADPESIKKGLKASYRHLLERDFEHLLLAHGQPWVGGARRLLTA